MAELPREAPPPRPSPSAQQDHSVSSVAIPRLLLLGLDPTLASLSEFLGPHLWVAAHASPA